MKSTKVYTLAIPLLYALLRNYEQSFNRVQLLQIEGAQLNSSINCGNYNHHMHKKLVFLLGSTCYIETYFYLEEFQSYLQRSTNLTHSNILCFKYPSTSTSYENVGRPQAFATSEKKEELY